MAAGEPNIPLRRLGLWNGLLLGLALALGAWASDAIFLAISRVQWVVYPALFLGSLILLFLGGVGGWLAAGVGRAWASLLIWLVIGSLMTWVIGHTPYEGRSLMVWLADRRSWGLAIYPFNETAATAAVLAGFFILLLLGVMGLLQPYRLEGLVAEADEQGHLQGRGWFLLLLPLPLAVAVGLIADHMVNRPLRLAPQLVHQAIHTGRTYPGDLFELSRRTGLNYNAISAVRQQMSRRYSLSIGPVDLGVVDTIWVIADFDNGAWINCRVVAEQLSFCYDARPPYLQGFPAFITSGQMPADCPECAFAADKEQREWLQARSGMFRGPPRVARLAQWGSYVLLQAESSAGDYAIQCLFSGANPVHLERCWEVKAR